MADYPGAVTSFATLVDYVDYVLAAHANERADEIVAIETELGTNPSGSAATLTARLTVSMNDDGTMKNDLGAIEALTPSNDDIIQRKAGAWTNRSMSQLADDLPIVDACRAYHSSAQTCGNGVTTTITFDSETYDTNSIHDGTNPTRLTCKKAGLYFISGAVSLNANPDGPGSPQMWVYLNNTTTIIPAGTAFSGDQKVITLAGSYALAVNDYIELQFYQASGGDLTTAANATMFSMARIGRVA